MAKTDIVMVLYDPPAAGLPYLAVAIFPDGEAAATPYDNLQDAQRHVESNAASAIRMFREDNA